jgi:hypothetical protein
MVALLVKNIISMKPYPNRSHFFPELIAIRCRHQLAGQFGHLITEVPVDPHFTQTNFHPIEFDRGF